MIFYMKMFFEYPMITAVEFNCKDSAFCLLSMMISHLFFVIFVFFNVKSYLCQK